MPEPEDNSMATLAKELIPMIEYFISYPKHWQIYKLKLLHPEKPYSELAAEAGMRSKQHFQWYLRKIAKECPIVKSSVLINRKFNSGHSIFN